LGVNNLLGQIRLAKPNISQRVKIPMVMPREETTLIAPYAFFLRKKKKEKEKEKS
jgi:hypothetical protein